MIKKYILLGLLLLCLLGVGLTTQARADSGITVFTTVEFDDQNEEVGGISETYATYDIAYYYDAGADGILFYTNPTDIVDGDVGEGTDDIYYDLDFGLMYGIEVDYTTNDYRRNKIVCADTIHYFRAIFQPTPIGTVLSYYDPYELSRMTSRTDESSFTATINTNNPNTSNYIPNDIIVIGESYACIRTPTVASVEFQTINSLVTNDNPATAGGGQRIFPERVSPTDNSDTKTVQVKAQLASSGGQPTYTSGVKVYFKNFDVDDASDDDDIIDPNGTLGNDNREGRIVDYSNPQPYPASAAGTITSSCTGALGVKCALTDSNGIAVVNFAVTRQPGDNFRIAASTEEPYLDSLQVDGFGLKDPSNNPLPTARAKQTQLLTVWRKFHLEVDSMGEAANNQNYGYVKTRSAIGQTPVWINVMSNGGALLEHKYQATYAANGTTILKYGGRISLSGGIDLQVLDNTTTSIQVRSASGTVQTRLNQLYNLYDEDDFSSNDGDTYKGDKDEEIDVLYDTFSRLQPSTSIAVNLFAAAFIEPEFQWAAQQPGMNDTDVPFETNHPVSIGSGAERAKIEPYRDSKEMERDDFWICYFLIAYQSEQHQENDPHITPQSQSNGYGWIGGIAPYISIQDFNDGTLDSRTVNRGSIGAILYIEALRDLDSGPNPSSSIPFQSRIRSAPHELGHQFGIRGDSTNPIDQIMAREGTSPLIEFADNQINLMRWRIKSPGEE